MADSQGLPDYVFNPNAVLGDTDAIWRHGKPPSYTKTRDYYEKTKTMTHEASSLPDLVSNLVKNWEIEASYKTSLSDWRTIDQSSYTFSLNGGPEQSGEHMLAVGTYNALISANKYYDPEQNNFEDSHKSFKRMIESFAWEVKEVYSGPPVVVFRWRHWGVMRGDYRGVNEDGETVRIKAHGEVIDIEGIVVAKVNEKLQLQKIDVWFDPMDMFRQIAKGDKQGLEGKDAVAAAAGACPVLAGKKDE
ncbi:hypothetical protein BJY04DRAFT_221200 [Aspergillus karnatakaensis]|uniref:uncharacterized protein n=1 Tax=Aspergillus karnatakaensis TaxID=1810916 RepID=UPI003CCD676B